MAHAEGGIAPCNKRPATFRLPEPSFPQDFESRGARWPITVIVEFTVGPGGFTVNARAVESHAGSYGPEFEELAVAAVMGTRFARISQPCRGRIKIAWKLADK